MQDKCDSSANAGKTTLYSILSKAANTPEFFTVKCENEKSERKTPPSKTSLHASIQRLRRFDELRVEDSLRLASVAASRPAEGDCLGSSSDTETIVDTTMTAPHSTPRSPVPNDITAESSAGKVGRSHSVDVLPLDVHAIVGSKIRPHAAHTQTDRSGSSGGIRSASRIVSSNGSSIVVAPQSSPGQQKQKNRVARCA